MSTNATTVIRFRSNADGTAVCPHRDLSVCTECASHPEIVEVSGAHFHIADPAERAELAAMLADES